MKKILFVIIGSLLLSSAIAQNKKVINDANAQVRAVSGYHAIKVATGIHLFLSQGKEEAVAVSASDMQDRDRIKTVVEHGVLKIYYDNDHWNFHDHNNRKLRAYVSCKVLDALSASSGAQVEVDGTITATNLALDFASGSGFKGDVSVTELSVDQASGAESNISGKASTVKAEASSGSSLRAFDLQADQCQAKASSGASVDISVSKALTASAHSGGHISYKGSGVITTVNTGSGGSVSKR